MEEGLQSHLLKRYTKSDDSSLPLEKEGREGGLPVYFLLFTDILFKGGEINHGPS
jgi:hypothetical protein